AQSSREYALATSLPYRASAPQRHGHGDRYGAAAFATYGASAVPGGACARWPARGTAGHVLPGRPARTMSSSCPARQWAASALACDASAEYGAHWTGPPEPHRRCRQQYAWTTAVHVNPANTHPNRHRSG